jgi:hypothetical protein
LVYALCNEWEHFVTLTINQAKYDRYDLDLYRKELSQWVRDQIKHTDIDIRYVLIPEKHENGAWHVHGLMRGVPDKYLSKFVKGKHPDKLVNSDYMNFERYERKFGFCSFGKIRDSIASAFYIIKYLQKDLSRSVTEYSAHLYYASQGLQKAENLYYIYGNVPELDKKLTYEGEFCSVGW